MPDKVRMRIEVRAVLEYDADLSDYGVEDPDEIVKIDQATADDVRALVLRPGRCAATAVA